MDNAGIRAIVTIALLLALAISGCGLGGPIMDESGRMTVTSPQAMEVVSTPFQVTWEPPASPPSRYAVFVDRQPLPPGQDFTWLATQLEDDLCLSQSDCPNDSWLNARSIYVVDEPRVKLDVIREQDVGSDLEHVVHRLTIVGLDEDGARNSEAAGYVEFVTQRDGSA